MKRFIAGLLLPGMVAFSTVSADVNDPRFFGTYCGDASVQHCVRYEVKVLGVTVREGRRCEDIELKDIEAKLEHRNTAHGGLVSGQGTVEIEGDRVPFVLAGAVTRKGRARGSATVSGLEPHYGSTSLSPDGLALTIRAYNKKLTVRKDQCGNTPPQAEIVGFPSGPLAYGESFIFRAEVSDAEDLSFPPERLNWHYDGDKPLASISNLTAQLPVLLPGEHPISFSVTDSGGLTTTVTKRLTITNTAPKTPRILLPPANRTVEAGCDLNFVGQAYDNEEGFLGGSSLRWRSSVDGALGAGAALSASLATVGPHSIELRAVDSAGAASQTMITLDARDAANGCTPRARIVKPEYYEATTWVIDGTTPTLFVGEAADAEDSLDQLSMEWEARPINPSGPMISLGTGDVIETSDLVTIGNQVTEYEVRFVVSDSDGNMGVDQMRLFVLGFIVQ